MTTTSLAAPSWTTSVPGLVLLALMGAVAAGITMPEMAARLSGLDPQSPEFVDRYGEQLRQLVRRLRAGT